MKTTRIIVPAGAVVLGIFLAACQADPVYVPVYVPVDKTPKKVAPATPKPAPKPAESAEGFRAVEKPATYSN